MHDRRNKLHNYYSRIPAAAVKREFDGHLYAYVPHAIERERVCEDFDKPRMMRFCEPASFYRDGEAYVLIGRRGDAIPLGLPLPFGVTCIKVADHE